ncbi:MarR family transcriptional regulator [Flavobacterium supellecticarium]|uniref:MarR family transcriptional regulator n=1 Tax=Flavobacterium supellecticarium TaxID=2565924 RepID=A0A4S3ZVJ7_9FLAO|nr:MarR family transcriptional regulator [Flavobacterium supellecticarium]THF49836.1 MarR family transcriptional regulator [Flavobacterium supellecticarium]
MINKDLNFLLNMAKVQSIVSRKFDSLSVHGIGFSDFMILYVLYNAPGQRMRRIDLAERIGLTASGVTRLLAPLEKIGLVGREVNERDARVSYVVITENGEKLFEEAKVTAEDIATTLLPAKKGKSIQLMTELLAELGGNL